MWRLCGCPLVRINKDYGEQTFFVFAGLLCVVARKKREKRWQEKARGRRRVTVAPSRRPEAALVREAPMVFRTAALDLRSCPKPNPRNREKSVRAAGWSDLIVHFSLGTAHERLQPAALVIPFFVEVICACCGKLE